MYVCNPGAKITAMHLIQNAETINCLVEQGECLLKTFTPQGTRLNSCVAISQAGALRYTRCMAIARKRLLSLVAKACLVIRNDTLIMASRQGTVV